MYLKKRKKETSKKEQQIKVKIEDVVKYKYKYKFRILLWYCDEMKKEKRNLKDIKQFNRINSLIGLNKRY